MSEDDGRDSHELGPFDEVDESIKEYGRRKQRERTQQKKEALSRANQGFEDATGRSPRSNSGGDHEDLEEEIEDDVEEDLEEGLEEEVDRKTEEAEEEIRSELGQTEQFKHTRADHHDHGGGRSSSGSWSIPNVETTRGGIMMFLAMALHLFDYAYMGIQLTVLPLKLVIYAAFALLSYFVIEGGAGGLSKRQALRHYTALTVLAVFLFPLLTSTLNQFIPDAVLQEVQAARLLLAWYPLYYLTMRGFAGHKSYNTITGWLGGFINPITLVKRFYIALILFAIINVGLASVVTETASDLDNQIGNTPRLDPWEGVERISGFFYDGYNKTWVSVVKFANARANDTAQFIQDPLGTGYETDVEKNLLGVEVSMETQNDRSVVRRLEGDEYNLQAAIQYSSQFELNDPSQFVCELLNSDGDVVRREYLEPSVLGGQATNSVFKTCTFANLSTGDRSTTRYTARMRSVLPFRTQAVTEYYFASDEFARDPAQRSQYRSEIQSLDADTADAITTEGPVKLKTSNDLVNLPVVVSEDESKIFPYGFSLEAKKGEIVNVTHVEMDLPSYFTVNETPTCQITKNPSRTIREPRSGYEKIAFNDYLYINRNEQPYAACNIQYDPDNYDELIWSDSTIQPVTFSVIAEYNYEMDVEQELIVEEPVRAKDEVNESGNQSNESLA